MRREKLSEQDKQFRRIVRTYFRQHGRTFPWRKTTDPYHILVSELMLQQTQAHRVVPKFESFINAFPSSKKLAQASMSDVLSHWQGLGYNRRALYLKRSAEMIEDVLGGVFPAQDIEQLPGVGPYTARAVRVFAYNEPEALIETNIRTAYIHHYFDEHAERVTEAEIEHLVLRTVDERDPRGWFNALMDYGAHLKATVGNLNKKSATYTKQSRFVGSTRQLRGKVLRLLLEKGSMSEKQILRAIDDERIPEVLSTLAKDSMIVRKGSVYRLTE
jgi:A/G-specific adenine glycosylase